MTGLGHFGEPFVRVLLDLRVRGILVISRTHANRGGVTVPVEWDRLVDPSGLIPLVIWVNWDNFRNYPKLPKYLDF